MTQERAMSAPSAMVAELRCKVCDAVATRVELVAPGQPPAEWDEWKPLRREQFLYYRDPADWYLLFQGVEGGNGWVSDPIDLQRAERLSAAFQRPWTFERIHTAGFYDDAGWCELCNAPYCSRHWAPSTTGYGHCPEGHGKSLDPHWSPDY